MVLVLIGALFIPMSAGAEEKGMRVTTPDLAVMAEVNESADYMDINANASTNIKVTLENKGTEDIFTVDVAVVIHKASGEVEEDTLPNQMVQYMAIGQKDTLLFGPWNPSNNGSYYAVVTAVAGTYPDNGLPASITSNDNLTIGIGSSMNVNVTNAFVSDSGGNEIYSFMNVTGWHFYGIGSTLYFVGVVKNTGNMPMAAVNVTAKIYDDAGPTNVIYYTGTVSGTIMPGGEEEVLMGPWTALAGMYQLEVNVTHIDDMNNTDNRTTMNIDIQDLTDVMPVGIVSHMNGGIFKNVPQVFTAQVKNNGTLALTENFHVGLTFTPAPPGGQPANQTVDYTTMMNPGDTADVAFPAVTLVDAMPYTINVTTYYSLSGPDDDTANNDTGAVFSFQILNTEGFNLNINMPMVGKQETHNITVNVSVENSGSLDTADLDPIDLNLTIYDTMRTPGQADDVLVASEVVAGISIGAGAMMYNEFTSWLATEQYFGEFMINVNLINATDKLGVEDSVIVEFPNPNGTAHFMITPAAETEGAMVKVMDGATELAGGVTLSDGLIGLSVIPGGPYTMTVSDVWGYMDNQTAGSMIYREVITHAPMNMDMMTDLGTLAGYVVDVNGDPVEGAAVTVETMKANAPDTTSNETGYYDLGAMENITATVVASMFGYITNSTMISIPAGTDVMENITIMMEPAPVDVTVDIASGGMASLGDTTVTDVSTMTGIDLAFEDEINVSTVESNIMLKDPAGTVVPGTWDINGSASNMNFSFMPATELNLETIYDVMIMAGLQMNDSVGGGDWYFDMDKKLQFETEAIGAFTVKGKVVDEDYQTVEGVNVTVAGMWSITDSDGTFEFTMVPVGNAYNVTAHDKMFFGYTQYKAGAGSWNASVDVVDADVTLMEFLFVMEQPLPVDLTEPADTINVSADTDIVFMFDEEMNGTLVSEQFSVVMSGQTNPIEGNLSSTDNKTFTFAPNETLEYEQTYEITIGSSVEGIDSDPVLWEDFTHEFTVMAEPMVLTATIKIAGTAATVPLTGVAVDAVITVEFNYEMNTTAIGSLFTITASGSTTTLVTDSTWNTGNTIVTLTHLDFSEGTTYTVTVGKSVMSLADGLGLTDDETGTFTTEITTPPAKTLTLNIKGTGTVTLKDASGATVGTGTISGNKVDLTYPGDLAAGTYTVDVDATGDFNDKSWKIVYDGTNWTGDATGSDVVKLVEDEEAGTPMALILAIVVIVIVIIVVMVIVAMRKKPEEEEMPADEEGAMEEGAGEFECPACGALVSADEGVCPECGEEFEEEEFKCPECEAPIEADSTTCEACGAEFELEEDAAEEGEEGEEGEEEEYEVEDEEGEDLEGDEEIEEGEEELEGEEAEDEESLEDEEEMEAEEGLEEEDLGDDEDILDEEEEKL